MKLIGTISLFFLLTLPVYAQIGEGHTPLVNIPGVSGAVDLGTLLSALFNLLIAVAVIAAVVRLTIAGIRYMTSESPISLGDAKHDFFTIGFGLLLILGAVIILNLINPEITRMNIFRSVTSSNSQQGSNTGTPSGTGNTSGTAGPLEINIGGTIPGANCVAGVGLEPGSCALQCPSYIQANLETRDVIGFKECASFLKRHCSGIVSANPTQATHPVVTLCTGVNSGS